MRKEYLSALHKSQRARGIVCTWYSHRRWGGGGGTVRLERSCGLTLTGESEPIKDYKTHSGLLRKKKSKKRNITAVWLKEKDPRSSLDFSCYSETCGDTKVTQEGLTEVNNMKPH